MNNKEDQAIVCINKLLNISIWRKTYEGRRKRNRSIYKEN